MCSSDLYSALFAAQPTVRQEDYAKWQLEDPKVNFAISSRPQKTGVDHLGIQAESGDELEDLGSRLAQADVAVTPQKDATCCYARSDKYWTIDPQGVAWESFHTLEAAPVYGADRTPDPRAGKGSCCAPAAGRKGAGCC